MKKWSPVEVKGILENINLQMNFMLIYNMANSVSRHEEPNPVL